MTLMVDRSCSCVASVSSTCGDHSQTESTAGAEQLPELRSWISQVGHGSGTPVGCGLCVDRGQGLRDRAPAAGRRRRIGAWLVGSSAAHRVDSQPRRRGRADPRRIHELAHSRADHFGREVSRPPGETDADSIAHVVATWAGLDISGSSVDYVAGGSGADVDVLEAALAAIHRNAAAVVTDLEQMARAPQAGQEGS
jgi:hypothetical protein